MPLNQNAIRHIKWRYLRCPNCGNINLLPNVRNRRKLGHIKTMICFYCNHLVNMTEMSEWCNHVK